MRAKSMMVALSLSLAACAGQEWTTSEPPTAEEDAKVDKTISAFLNEDPGIKNFFDESHGYVVFPDVGRGGLVVGGAHGTGWVYERGRLIGRASMTQLSVGAQAGGAAYSEIIFFRDANTMDAFKAGKLELGATVSAVIVKRGAAASTGYDPSGVAVFVRPLGGAMAEASVGGQKFELEPLAK
jgi:lipid-binding SYLF domain-containing protein